ncbi:MAG: hypothetical protein Q8S10_07740 [Thiobacillus sp.]|nr:hypothetical protein [Thiobacillus sp.]
MNILRPILFASLLALASPLLAQDAHQHHGGPAAASSTAALEQIAPAPAGKEGCEKCKKAGMGDKMAGGDMDGMGGMGGMSCCKGKQGGKSCCGGMHAGMHGGMHAGMHGGGDTAALERRINELEKRLDLMQALLQRKTR